MSLGFSLLSKVPTLCILNGNMYALISNFLNAVLYLPSSLMGGKWQHLIASCEKLWKTQNATIVFCPSV